jgi:transcriptional regulator with XRE-family HTH domain
MPRASGAPARAGPAVTPVRDGPADTSPMSGAPYPRRMDGSRTGRGLRAIRIRLRLRQADVAARAKVPRAAVARIERGDLDGVRLGQLRAVAIALRADLDLVLRWEGTELDRLLNAGHSAMHELVVGILVAAGWEVVPERSFSVWGERGVIDILAWHAATRMLLVVELKTEIVEVQRLIGTVDRYRRLAPATVRDLDWEPISVGVWVVVAESATNRRRLGEHVQVLRAAFPSDGRTVSGWLRNPSGPLRALSFLADARLANRTAARSSRRRVRVALAPGPGAGEAAAPDQVPPGRGV